MPAHADPPPAIVIVAEDRPRRTRLRDALGRWFATDYRLVEAEFPALVENVVRELRDAATEVALIIAEERMPSEAGTALFSRVRDLLLTHAGCCSPGGPTRPRRPRSPVPRSWATSMPSSAGPGASATRSSSRPSAICSRIGRSSTRLPRLHAAPRRPRRRRRRRAPEHGDLLTPPISFHDTRSASGNALSHELPAGAQLPAGCSSPMDGCSAGPESVTSRTPLARTPTSRIRSTWRSSGPAPPAWRPPCTASPKVSARC